MPWQRNMQLKELLPAKQRNTNAAGSAVDLQGTIHPKGREMKAFLSVGAVTGTTPTLNVGIQESDTTTAGDFADISGATFTTASTIGNQEIHFRASKRYVRALSTVGGTSPVFDAAVLVLAEKLQQ